MYWASSSPEKFRWTGTATHFSDFLRQKMEAAGGSRRGQNLKQMLPARLGTRKQRTVPKERVNSHNSTLGLTIKKSFFKQSLGHLLLLFGEGAYERLVFDRMMDRRRETGPGVRP